MKVTQRVYNSDNETVGFTVEGSFFNCFTILNNINRIENLTVTKNGIFKAKRDSNIENVTLKQLNKQKFESDTEKNPFKRDITESFLTWKKEYGDSKVLYLRGPRQVGKTTELLKFAYANYEYVIYVNLADTNVLNTFLNIVMPVGSKFLEMSDFCDVMNLPRYNDSDKTILILDEIQVSSTVFNSLRTLLSNLNCHIAVTGSYLGAVLKPEFFQPAGNTYDLDLLPLSFREFCRVFDEEQNFETVDIAGGSNKSVYVKLTELYKLYLEIGGFPEIVNNYRKNKNIDSCLNLLKQLTKRFTDESAAYFGNDADKSRLVFEGVYKAAVSAQLREKKGTGKDLSEFMTQFIKTDTKCPVTRQEVNNAVSWLQYNGVLGSCDLYNQGDPMQLFLNRRCYFTDTGLLNYMLSIVPVQDSDKKGLLAETFAYNELRRLYLKEFKCVIGDKPTCAVYNNYELDFLIFDKNNKRYGIEIKSNNSSNPKSLLEFSRLNLIDEAVVAEITKGGVGYQFRTIPIYLVGDRFPYNN